MSVRKHFIENRYAYFSNVISKQEAKKLSDNLFKRKKEGLLVSDDQCPLSHAIYGDPVYDELLERLSRPLSEQIGIELLPAYSYARLYDPGEKLERHRDRFACEISVTMTLGYHKKSGIWPFYVQEDETKKEGIEIIIEPGDMVLYTGPHICHWREEYKGVWQTQVFLHYVDANGKYKDRRYDTRQSLAHQSASEWNNSIQKIKNIQAKNLDRNRARLGSDTGPDAK
jgi:hypothetical protein